MVSPAPASVVGFRYTVADLFLVRIGLRFLLIGLGLVGFFLVRFFLFLGLNREQFHFEDQSGIGANVGARAALAVSQVGGDKNLILGSDGHQLQRFGPSFNHAADGERGRLTALVAGIEFGAVDQRAAIVYRNRVVGSRRRPGALGDDLILQAVGRGLDAVFGFVLGQKSVARFLVLLAFLFHLGLLLLAHFLLHVHDGRLGFFIGEQGFAAGQAILHATLENGGIHGNVLLMEVGAHLHTEGIAELVFRSLERERRSGGLGRARARLLGRGSLRLAARGGRRSLVAGRSLLRERSGKQNSGGEGKG